MAHLQRRPLADPPPVAPSKAARYRPDRPHRLLASLPPRCPGRSRRTACGLFPLSYYRGWRSHTLRTDARDRFGTPLEQRFTRAQIRQMCTAAGLVDLRFSSREPCRCVVEFKAES